MPISTAARARASSPRGPRRRARSFRDAMTLEEAMKTTEKKYSGSRGPAAAELGRIPDRARDRRVLAGAPQPAPRPAPLPARAQTVRGRSSAWRPDGRRPEVMIYPHAARGRGFRRGDPVRPLSPKGREQVARVCAALSGPGFQARRRSWHSPLARSRETAELLASGPPAGGAPRPGPGSSPTTTRSRSRRSWRRDEARTWWSWGTSRTSACSPPSWSTARALRRLLPLSQGGRPRPHAGRQAVAVGVARPRPA
jgi:hypothetical protein